MFALPPQGLPQRIAGDELYTRGHTKVAPDESHGWTRVWMDRATGLMWDMPCGRRERTVCKKALRLWGHVSEPPGDLTLLTEGERRP